MGLISSTTDLRALRYGNDRKGGGSSNQPYITNPIPDGTTINTPDFLWRKGAFDFTTTNLGTIPGIDLGETGKIDLGEVDFSKRIDLINTNINFNSPVFNWGSYSGKDLTILPKTNFTFRVGRDSEGRTLKSVGLINRIFNTNYPSYKEETRSRLVRIFRIKSDKNIKLPKFDLSNILKSEFSDSLKLGFNIGADFNILKINSFNILKTSPLPVSLSLPTDALRISKFMFDTSSLRGFFFITKQLLLERQNSPTAGGINRIYNPGSTITQAALLPLGFHLNKQGLNPFSPPSYFVAGASSEGYFGATLDRERIPGDSPNLSNPLSILDQTTPEQDIEGGKNRLALLYSSKIKQTTWKRLDNLNPFGVTGPEDTVTLLSFLGGPNSLLSVLGRTNIRIWNPTTKYPNQLTSSDGFYLFPEGKTRYSINRLETLYRAKIIKDNTTPSENLEYFNISPLNDFLFKYGKDTYKGITLGTTKISITNSTIKNSEKGDINKDKSFREKGLNGDGYYGLSNKLAIDAVGRLGSLLETKIYKKTLSVYPFNISNDDNLLFDYSNNPTKELTLGTTKVKITDKLIERVTNDTNLQWAGDIITRFTGTPFTPYPNFKADVNKTQKEKQSSTLLSLLNPTYNPNIGKFNREKTYSTSWSTKGSSTRSTTYALNPNDHIDSDLMNVPKGGILNITSGDSEIIEELKNSDLIKFYFEIISNSGNAKDNDFVFFRAYINDIGDNFKGEWSDYKYVGRAEKFYKYGGFSRTINLDFSVYAHSRTEMDNIYGKINRLAGLTSPVYSGAGLMQGQFTKLTVGDWFIDEPVIITDVSLKPSLEAGWDINREANGDIINPDGTNSEWVGQLPRLVDVQLSIIPLHTFAPQYNKQFIRNTDNITTPSSNNPNVATNVSTQNNPSATATNLVNTSQPSSIIGGNGAARALLAQSSEEDIFDYPPEQLQSDRQGPPDIQPRRPLNPLLIDASLTSLIMTQPENLRPELFKLKNEAVSEATTVNLITDPNFKFPLINF